MRALLALATLILVACGSGTTTTTETTQPATPAAVAQPTAAPQPTANVAGTVEAAVKATVEAAAKATIGAAPPAAPTIGPKPLEPTPALKPSGAARVEAIDFNHYTDSIGGTVIQGLVQNKGDADAGIVHIVVSLLGNSGATVGAGETYTTPSLLKPDQKGVFEVRISKGPEFKDVKVQVQAQPADSMARGLSYGEFKFEGISIGPPASGSEWGKLSGQLVNTGAKTASLITIAIAIYGPDGKVHFVDLTSAKLNEVGPGQSSPFEFTFATNRPPVPIEKYDLFVNGLPKS